MGEKLCWDRWKNIISGKIDSSTKLDLFVTFSKIVNKWINNSSYNTNPTVDVKVHCLFVIKYTFPHYTQGLTVVY